MQKPSFAVTIAAVALLALVVAIGSAAWQHARGALWRIVSTGCVPAAATGATSACAVVVPGHDGAPGYAVLKDRHGPLQYLLIPTRRVTGIEDAALLAPTPRDYLAEAWAERRWMDAAHEAPVPREDVALALNSAWSRSQDQLHVHISCIRADLRERLRTLAPAAGDRWMPLPGGWRGHPYEVRSVQGDTLDGVAVLRTLAAAHPDDLGRQAIAVVAGGTPGRPALWLLATHLDLASGWLGGIEGDVQDHECGILAGTPVPTLPPATTSVPTSTPAPSPPAPAPAAPPTVIPAPGPASGPMTAV